MPPASLGENQDLIVSRPTHPRPLDQLPQWRDWDHTGRFADPFCLSRVLILCADPCPPKGPCLSPTHLPARPGPPASLAVMLPLGGPASPFIHTPFPEHSRSQPAASKPRSAVQRLGTGKRKSGPWIGTRHHPSTGATHWAPRQLPKDGGGLSSFLPHAGPPPARGPTLPVLSLHPGGMGSQSPPRNPEVTYTTLALSSLPHWDSATSTQRIAVGRTF